MIVLPMGWTGSAYGVAPVSVRPAAEPATAAKRHARVNRGVVAGRRPATRGRDLVLALGWTSGSYGRPAGRIRRA